MADIEVLRAALEMTRVAALMKNAAGPAPAPRIAADFAGEDGSSRSGINPEALVFITPARQVSRPDHRTWGHSRGLRVGCGCQRSAVGSTDSSSGSDCCGTGEQLVKMRDCSAKSAGRLADLPMHYDTIVHTYYDNVKICKCK